MFCLPQLNHPYLPNPKKAAPVDLAPAAVGASYPGCLSSRLPAPEPLHRYHRMLCNVHRCMLCICLFLLLVEISEPKEWTKTCLLPVLICLGGHMGPLPMEGKLYNAGLNKSRWNLCHPATGLFRNCLQSMIIGASIQNSAGHRTWCTYSASQATDLFAGNARPWRSTSDMIYLALRHITIRGRTGERMWISINNYSPAVSQPKTLQDSRLRPKNLCELGGSPVMIKA